MNPDNKTIDETNIQTIVDITPTKKNIIMDSQILSTLMACPCLADYRFNHNLQSLKGKSNSIECGSIVHKYLEIYYKSIINGLDKPKSHGFGMTSAELYIKGCPLCTDFSPSESVNGIVAKPECGHKPNDYPGVTNTPSESENYKTGWRFVLDTCEQYYEFYKNDFWVPLEVEIVKSKILYEDSEIRILWKGKLDLVSDTNQGIYPIDHKTMKQNRPNLNLNNQFTGQCILMNTRQVIINKIGFQKTLKPEEKFKREVVSYTASRLLEWQSEILPYYGNMLLTYAESGVWPRNYTSCEGKYGQCAFVSVCSANDDMREEELRNNFKVGPIWNPKNEDSDE